MINIELINNNNFSYYLLDYYDYLNKLTGILARVPNTDVVSLNPDPRGVGLGKPQEQHTRNVAIFLFIFVVVVVMKGLFGNEQ